MFEQVPSIVWPILIFAAFVAVVLLVARFGNGSSRPPYKSRGAIFTGEEKGALLALERAVGQGYRVYPQVRLANLLQVPRNAHERQRWQGRLNSRRVDYVIVDANSFEPWLVVEVSEKKNSDMPDEATQFINEAFAASGHALLRLTPAEACDESYLRGLFAGRKKTAA